MSHRRSRILLAVIVLSTLASILFGVRSYGSFLLLRSAYEAGRPQVSSLRAWMTLDHVAATYRVPMNELIPRLGLAPETSGNESLKDIADRRGVPRFDFLRQVQRVLGQSAPVPESSQSSGGLTDRILSALLIYGYPALALTLLLGAIGLPLPIGVAAVLAGSLAALGNLRWEWAGLIAVTASFAGDMIAYGIGRAVSDSFLARHGRWIGYSPQRRDSIQGFAAKVGRPHGGRLAHSDLVTELGGEHLRRREPLSLVALSGFRFVRAADLDLGLSGLGLRDRRQYRGRQPVPRQFERAHYRARRAGGGERLSGRHRAFRGRLKPVATP
jgi:hypothetical protein